MLDFYVVNIKDERVSANFMYKAEALEWAAFWQYGFGYRIVRAGYLGTRREVCCLIRRMGV